jgi:hypothetical protein
LAGAASAVGVKIKEVMTKLKRKMMAVKNPRKLCDLYRNEINLFQPLTLLKNLSY